MNRLIPFLLVITMGCSLPDFFRSTGTPDQFNERLDSLSFNGDIRVHVYSPKSFVPKAPTHLVLFALPNGNSIEWTLGKQLRPGDDWHYNIQHIGAQMRRVRHLVPEENYLVAYLEASGKSWPAWRRNHPDGSAVISRLVDTLRLLYSAHLPHVTLNGHSGGGSFIWGFLNASDSIPAFIERISFLDSNYSFEDSLGHGTKMLQWLHSDSSRTLCIFAYDDRYIMLNGKRVVGPDGGTLRATNRMIASFSKEISISEQQDSVIRTNSGMNGQIRMFVQLNPDTLILHTVLVERNGFINSLLLHTPYEHRADPFWGEKRYQEFIQR